MQRTKMLLVITLVLSASISLRAQDVLQEHGNAFRNGLYVDPQMTQKAAAAIHLDRAFNAALPGPVYAQPLYVSHGPGGKPALIVVTEQDMVLALDAATGATLWSRQIGSPVPRSALACGNINPLGITSTPAIDLPKRTIYTAGMTTPDNGKTKRHLIVAISLDDGSVRSGWPVDVSGVRSGNFSFESAVQNQRSALLLNNGVLYVGYGGHAGDCGDYHGWVLAVRVDHPKDVTAWVAGSRGGAVWAPGGMAADGKHVFVATGNTYSLPAWTGGEAVLRFTKGVKFSGRREDYFLPSNWKELDDSDSDLGGTGPLLIDVPGANPSALLVAMGKNGVAYLLNRNDLGGSGKDNGIEGEGVQSKRVSSGQIINVPAAYTAASGTYVVLETIGKGVGCPEQPGNLVALRIGASAPPTIQVAWCADNMGRGSPIVTTPDGKSQPIVWTAGAEASNRLHGFNGETGEPIFAGGGAQEQMTTVQRFQTPIDVDGRIFVAANNRLYAFTVR